MRTSQDILSSPIEYLKGVGPQRAELLKKELSIFTFEDLLHHFPYRHVDKTRISTIASIDGGTDYVQVAGELESLELVGQKGRKRLVGLLRDPSGTIELLWFEGVSWIQKSLQPGRRYLVYGKAGFYQGHPQIVHPEMDPLSEEALSTRAVLEPVYPSTEKLKAKGLGGRAIGKLAQALFNVLRPENLPENIPDPILRQLRLASRFDSYRQIHFPTTAAEAEAAVRRLKFEEFFISQLKLARLRLKRHSVSKGVVFDKVGELFNRFYTQKLPFELTGAQKRVLKEIRADTAHGRQMNRLLQGDVGSGKTIVALLAMLLAIDNGYQACMMAPTEILAQQHFDGMSTLLAGLSVRVEMLTGSAKSARRKEILRSLADGEVQILVGTHAVIEDKVQFSKLGLAIVDEQHRFGVAQRARLWAKSEVPPHVLVMTATPIPRTLAMTAYGDLDYSIMDELPPGRQLITTVHRYENKRPAVMDFIRSEISKGRQVYIIFPLIEESQKLDYENLMMGYENVKAYFPEPKYWISMVHGRQPAQQKHINMQRFVTGDTQIMVSTTVIEVGVNVPNATVMVIESAERFGLSQLHQLRGRVGRGSEKSYCILITGKQAGNEARERMKVMTTTNDGFVIAEKDLELRGPGDIEGTRQSGELNFRLASLVKDRPILETARQLSMKILEEDPDLISPGNQGLKNFLSSQKGKTAWSRIS
ncbi:MAG TPA: ATP-dependent DNA helicase RecG [Chitinophagaceae bacterium]